MESYAPDPKEQLNLYFSEFKFLNNNRWYSFTYGNSLFLIIDTNTNYSPSSEQYKWLISKLSDKSPMFLFVFCHHPPYTKCEIAHYRYRKSEKFLANLFESYKEKGFKKVDIVFSSHVHNYERYKYNGVNYIVSGGGGAEPYPIERDQDDFYTESGDTFHYCKITVSETKVNFEMIRLSENGIWVIADSFTIP
jgi:hypothetical protein